MTTRPDQRRDDPLADLERWIADGQRAALATVVSTWGSSPRPVGSHMAVNEKGDFTGSVSGGCIEGAVVDAALASLRTGGSTLLDFGVSNEMAWEVGLACGGRIQVFVQPVTPMTVPLLSALQWRRSQKRACAKVTHISAGAAALVDEETVLGDLALSAAQQATVRARIGADRSGTMEGELFVRVYAPPLRMIIVGAVHIAVALVPVAVLAGFDVTVVDPREAFAGSEQMAGVAAIVAWPDEAMAALKPDVRTAVVTLTHDPKLDDPALAAALRSGAFYVGALGSRKTHARRLERLKAGGFSDADLSRIHGPVGLDINASTPAEIAVSIVAQVIGVLREEAA